MVALLHHVQIVRRRHRGPHLREQIERAERVPRSLDEKDRRA